jgi:hypothetical protein
MTDEELLRRVVRNARPRKRGRGFTRWIAVMHTFLVGSTLARQLCRRFDIDPDEKVHR